MSTRRSASRSHRRSPRRAHRVRVALALGLLLLLQGCVAVMVGGAVVGGVEGYRASQHHKAG